MKKVKIDQRIENAFNAFFETENDKTLTALTYGGETALVQDVSIETFTQKADKWFGIFKKVFLFLPGTFLLFFATLSSVFFYDIFGVNLWMLFWLASGSFMIWAGLGDLKNKKHLLMPLSVFSITLVLAILLSFLPESLQPSGFFEYSIYLFPLALIAPILVKNYLKEE
jgi:hypothetical protein